MEFTSEALVLNWEWLKAVGVMLTIAGIVIFALLKLVIMMISQDRFGVIRYRLLMLSQSPFGVIRYHLFMRGSSRKGKMGGTAYTSGGVSVDGRSFD